MILTCILLTVKCKPIYVILDEIVDGVTDSVISDKTLNGFSDSVTNGYKNVDVAKSFPLLPAVIDGNCFDLLVT
jgi:hypothetical protein